MMLPEVFLSKKYSKSTIIIHWLSFAGILALIPMGFYMSDLPIGESKLTLYKAHAAIGIVILLLTLFRVFIFFKHERPPGLETGSVFHNKLIIWIHNAFYFVILLLCFSGIVTLIQSGAGSALQSGDFNNLPQEMNVPPLTGHQILAKIFIALLLAHIGRVANHYIKTKENTLKRIF